MPSYCIRFCGITVRFRFPGPVELGPELTSFLCPDDGHADAEYTIKLLDRPLAHPDTPDFVYRDTDLYRTEEGWLRVCNALITEDGRQVACLLRQNGLHELYYPADLWDFYAAPLHCIHLLGAETLLLHCDAFLLHSSVVAHRGRAVLFSGPSGAGKSTQAALWAWHLGAEILNGDRCVIRRTPEGFFGGGSPWAGTSGIYNRGYLPIAGVFLVQQAPENHVRRLGAAAFMPLFTQTITNSWDAAFMERITGLYQEFLASTPVYLLSCRPDADAVRAAAEALFGPQTPTETEAAP